MFEYGTRIRQAVLKWVGIPCGIGFATSKTLAKIANHIGKKRPSGVFIMPDDPRPVLETLPVGEVWGVGRRLAPKLAALGLQTAWQLAAADEGFLRRKFNVTLAKTASGTTYFRTGGSGGTLEKHQLLPFVRASGR